MPLLSRAFEVKLACVILSESLTLGHELNNLKCLDLVVGIIVDIGIIVDRPLRREIT